MSNLSLSDVFFSSSTGYKCNKTRFRPGLHLDTAQCFRRLPSQSADLGTRLPIHFPSPFPLRRLGCQFPSPTKRQIPGYSMASRPSAWNGLPIHFQKHYAYYIMLSLSILLDRDGDARLNVSTSHITSTAKQVRGYFTVKAAWCSG